MSSSSDSAIRPRILFMDDEPDIRRVGSMVLRHLGCEAVAVNDGTEALKVFNAARAENRPFAAAILDLTIVGGMGGLETMRLLHEIDPGFKAIVSSGYTTEEVQAELASGTFAASVCKPYEIATLAAALDSVLGPRGT